MRVSDLIREASKLEGASNAAKPALKHINRAVEELGQVGRIIHDMREPEMDKLHDKINEVTGLIFKIMVPLSQRARRPA